MTSEDFDATDLTVVIPQHDQSELTLACLNSLRLHEQKKWTVVVVDDGSSNVELARLKRNIPEQVRVIPQSSGGVSAAWNRGMQEVSTDYVLFLNNDVLFHGPVVERLLSSLKLPSLKSPLPEEGHFQRCCGLGASSYHQPRLAGVRFRQERSLPGNWNRICPEIVFLEGWALACRVRDYDRLGGFDEQMRVYFSDTDFQLRVYEEFGPGSLVTVKNLPLEHLGHRTAHRLQTRNLVWRRDREMFFQKWNAKQTGKQNNRA